MDFIYNLACMRAIIYQLLKTYSHYKYYNDQSGNGKELIINHVILWRNKMQSSKGIFLRILKASYN